MMQNFEWLSFKRQTPNAEQVRLSITVDGKSGSPRMALVIGRKVADRLMWSHQGKVQIAAGKPGTSDAGKLLIAPLDDSRPGDALTLSSDSGPQRSTLKVATSIMPPWLTREKLSSSECQHKVTPNKWLEITVPVKALAVVEDDVKEAGAEPVTADPVSSGDTLHVAEDAFETKKHDTGEHRVGRIENSPAAVMPEKGGSSEKAPCTHGVGAAPGRKSDTAAPEDSKPVSIMQIRKDKVMAHIRSIYQLGGIVLSDRDISDALKLKGQDAVNAMIKLRKEGLVETAVDRRQQPPVRTVYLPEQGDTVAKAMEAPPVTKRTEKRKVETINDRVWHALDLAGETLTIDTGRGVTQRYIVNNRPMNTKTFLNHVNALLEQDGVSAIKMPRNLMEPLDIYPRASAA